MYCFGRSGYKRGRPIRLLFQEVDFDPWSIACWVRSPKDLLQTNNILKNRME
jgi:hypothetical protein